MLLVPENWRAISMPAKTTFDNQSSLESDAFESLCPGPTLRRKYTQPVQSLESQPQPQPHTLYGPSPVQPNHSPQPGRLSPRPIPSLPSHHSPTTASPHAGEGSEQRAVSSEQRTVSRGQ
eukprot:2975042-Rhodomonas_salina.1